MAALSGFRGGLLSGLAALAAATLIAGAASAQSMSSANCDSIIAAASLGQVEKSLYLSVQRTDGGPLAEGQAARIVMNIGAAFIPPKPFRLNVFSGPPLMRGLRSLNSATGTTPRVPTLTGAYRLWVAKEGGAPNPQIIRQAVMPGFDSAAVEAILGAATVRELFRVGDADSIQLEVTFGTDSLPGSRKLASAAFPRMPVVDAAPLSSNPPAVLPAGVEIDSASADAVILRFVVTRDGDPAAGTVEVLRARSVELLRAALEALVAQRFTPATINGCRVAQQVDYPFVFAKP